MINKKFKLIENRKPFLIIAAILLLVSFMSVFLLGLNPGVDLMGGSQWHISMEDRFSTVDMENFFFNEIGINVSVQELGEEGKIISMPEITEDERLEMQEILSIEYGEVETLSFTSIGPVVGQELRSKSMWAIFGVLLGIFLFVAWAFRKASKPIRSWKYGASALVTLVHDVGITIGFFAVLGYTQGLQIDTTIIVALLVVLGFSVNDTIVVFDRIRENLDLYKDTSMTLEEMFNKSIQQTIMRSINTSLTLVAVLISLIFFGPSTLIYFILTVLIGTLVGTYSSIFVASPLLYEWGRKR